MIKENRAWFLAEDGRAPLYFYVMFDQAKNKLEEIDFLLGKPVNLNDRGAIYYNVEPTKYGTEEYVRKWDFLPNSASVPLANKRALEILEQEAPGEFQVIPTKIVMPDGQVINDYKLINIINKKSAFNYDKSILDESKKDREDMTKYKCKYYNRDSLDRLNLCKIKESMILMGSDKLRKAVKKAKLVGLQFKDTYGTSHFFLDENGEIPEKYKR